MSRTLLLLACASLWICCNNPDSSSENGEITDTTTASASPTLSVTPTITPDQNPHGDTTGNGQSSPQNDRRSSDPGDAKMRVMVSFISKGEGIDHASKSKFDTWLAGRQNIRYHISPWGREGEVSYCFPLTELSTQEQAAFVSDVQNLLTNRNLVYINENIACEKSR